MPRDPRMRPPDLVDELDSARSSRLIAHNLSDRAAVYARSLDGDDPVALGLCVGLAQVYATLAVVDALDRLLGPNPVHVYVTDRP